MKSKKISNIIWALLAGIIAAGSYYYVALPPINIHAPGFWWSVIIALAVFMLVIGFLNSRKPNVGIGYDGKITMSGTPFAFKSKKAAMVVKTIGTVTVAVIIIFVVGSILSSPLVNASKYQKLLEVETRNFTEDIQPVSYNQIPILDKDSATIIGNRVMGTMVDMVSQYEISDNYAQINFNDKPYRVSPLKYGNLIKWITNNSNGLPGYIKVDMTTQEAEIVRLEEGIKYSANDHFNRNIYRHLRFAYPTYMFDNLNFEIDDNGIPFWICPVKKYNIGLFGGVTIDKVVICNAITGELTCYEIGEVPQWIDKVYSAEMLVGLYDYSGTLKHGYLNSVLGQRDCLMTTDGYNYIALEDDVWVYTGVTSVGKDQSNVGFVLMNQRTMETRYYEISGAEEYSAMSSAEGKVQHLGYKATFPLLLNIAGEPTYFIALKDGSGLVKQYAMLNIEKYQTVATAETVGACEKAYIQMLSENGITVPEVYSEKSISGKISKMAQLVIDGNSHYYVMLENSNDIFDVSIANYIDIIRYNVGDSIYFKYQDGEKAKTVIYLEKVIVK